MNGEGKLLQGCVESYTGIFDVVYLSTFFYFSNVCLQVLIADAPGGCAHLDPPSASYNQIECEATEPLSVGLKDLTIHITYRG